MGVTRVSRLMGGELIMKNTNRMPISHEIEELRAVTKIGKPCNLYHPRSEDIKSLECLEACTGTCADCNAVKVTKH